MHWQFGEMEFGEMKRNTSNWSNFCMLLRRAGLTASAGLSCFAICCKVRIATSHTPQYGLIDRDRACMHAQSITFSAGNQIMRSHSQH